MSVCPSVRPSVCLSVCLSSRAPRGAWAAPTQNAQTCKLKRHCATRKPHWPQSIHRFKTSWRHCVSFWTRNSKLSTLPVKESAKEKTSGIHFLRGRPTLLKYRGVATMYVPGSNETCPRGWFG